MFDYKKPCNDCPFRKSNAGNYMLNRDRLVEIFEAPAFECHKTTGVAGPKREPQQCAGLMALLYRARHENAIMRAARLLTDFDPATLDQDDCFTSLEECIAAHRLVKPDDSTA